MSYEQAARDDLLARRRHGFQIVFEESLRAVTMLMAVIFSGGILTGLPSVPMWILGAGVSAVALSVPVSILARLMGQHPHAAPSAQRWFHASVAGATAALLLTLLGVLARVLELGVALGRLSVMLGLLALYAYIRGTRLPDPDRRVSSAGDSAPAD